MSTVEFPDEILVLLLSEALSSPKEFLQVVRVCKQWNRVANNNSVWKAITLKSWPSLASSTKIKNWKKVAERRLRATGPSPGQNVIEGCDGWEFECPLKFDALQTVSQNIRYCNKCNQNVYYCNTSSELEYNVKMRRCVAFEANKLLNPISCNLEDGVKHSKQVLVLGAPKVGKSTLISTLTGATSKEATKGTCYSYGLGTLKRLKLALQETDTVERAHAFIVMFALNDPHTFAVAKDIISKIVVEHKDKSIILVGNKTDVEHKPPSKEPCEVAQTVGGIYMEMSAKNATDAAKCIEETHKLINANFKELPRRVMMGLRRPPTSAPSPQRVAPKRPPNQK